MIADLEENNKDTPLISIIIPVYNIEKYLNQCVESIVCQTYKNIEIILVDDGATDSCPQLCDEWLAKDNRIKVIHQTNGGLSAARNTGMKAAHGQFLGFVDGDDWVEPEMCEGAVKAALKYDADVVMWSYYREYENRSAKKKIFDRDIYFDANAVKSKLCRRIVGLVDRELAHPENGDALSTAWGKLYRFSLIQKYNIRFIDTKIVGSHEDGLFNFEFFRVAEKAVFIEQYWNHYRKTVEGQLSATYNEKRLKGSMGFFSLLKEKIEGDDDLRNDTQFYTALNNRICLSTISQSFNICRARVSERQKKALIQDLLFEPVYKSAFSTFSVEHFPLQWKLYFLCCKKGMAGLVLLLTESMLRLKNKIG